MDHFRLSRFHWKEKKSYRWSERWNVEYELGEFCNGEDELGELGVVSFYKSGNMWNKEFLFGKKLLKFEWQLSKCFPQV